MIDVLPKLDMPKRLTNDTFTFSLENIIENSLYYPSCGIDGDPVKYLMGNVYSFIYVDYGISKSTLSDAIKYDGFRGYRIIHREPVSKLQLDRGRDFPCIPEVDEREKIRLLHSDWIKAPFCQWFVFERSRHLNEYYNFQRFSMLYLCSEAVSAYYVLYAINNTSPQIFCIIQDGSAFGGNWTEYTNPNFAMAKAVYSITNLPEYLINGGNGPLELYHYHKPIWPGYSKEIL
jgi:hypothetical protein